MEQEPKAGESGLWMGYPRQEDEKQTSGYLSVLLKLIYQQSTINYKIQIKVRHVL